MYLTLDELIFSVLLICLFMCGVKSVLKLFHTITLTAENSWFSEKLDFNH